MTGFKAKPYETLEFTDDFIFWKVLTTNLELCQKLLELILDVKIKHIELAEGQETMQLEPDKKGIRLDVYVDDGEGTVYDIDMQMDIHKGVVLRIRYYQSVIDLNLLERGDDYSSLRKSVVIFICLKDIFDRGRSVYRFRNLSVDDPSLELGDGTEKVILNAEGDRSGLSDGMKNFLDYLKSHVPKDRFTQSLGEAVGIARNNEKWRSDYMKYEYDRWLLQKEGAEKQKAKDDNLVVGMIKGLMETYHVSADQAMDSMKMNSDQKRQYSAMLTESK